MSDIIDDLVIDICRETYDRFVMGGWEPKDAHGMIREMLREARAAVPQAAALDEEAICKAARQCHAQCWQWVVSPHGLGGQDQIDELAKIIREATAVPAPGERTEKAIEFGGYLANAAERFQTAYNVRRLQEDSDEEIDVDAFADVFRGLSSAIYEFRKRAERAGATAPPKEGHPDTFTVEMLDTSSRVVMEDGSLKAVSEVRKGDVVKGVSGPMRVTRERPSND